MDFVRRTLEKQLTSMRRTRASMSPEEAKRAAALGPVSQPVTLSSLRCPVTLADVSASSGDVVAVHDFLAAA